MRRFFSAALLVLSAILLAPAAALAHTEFVSSVPPDGATRERPVDRIEITFSGEASPAGEGFVVLDAAGAFRSPDRLTTSDKLTWVLEFDEALGGGEIGVRWSVAAPDTHPIEGSFSFTVPPVATAAESPDRPVAPDPQATVETVDLDAFLSAGPVAAPFVDGVGVIARAIGLLGAMVAIGGIVFAAIVMRGTERDIRAVLFWVRRASVVLALGTGLELFHQIAVVNGNWLTVWPPSTVWEVLWSSTGVAYALRLLGAALMASAHLEVVDTSVDADPILVAHAAVPVGAGPPVAELHPNDGRPYLHPDDKAWKAGGEIGVVLAGVLLALLSYSFDGHTVTAGTHVLTAAVDMVHVAAGAVWAGGLAMLVYVIWSRHRRGDDPRALQLAVRFSVVAAVSLALAGIAGLGLAIVILDAPSELWATPWGRTLLAKAAIVAAAGTAGGYNHAVLIPRMMETGSAAADFRRAVTVEAVAVGLIVVLTAVLVGAAS